MNGPVNGADEREPGVAKMIEAAYREGFYDRRTYDGMDLNTPDGEWDTSNAKRDADKCASLGAAQVPSLSDDARDAARYRCLRENAHPLTGSVEITTCGIPPCHIYGDRMDGFADAALSQQGDAK